MRSFARCYPSQRWQIFRHYEPDIYFFVSVCDDVRASDAELLREHYENVRVETYKDPELSEIPSEYGAWAPYANATTHDKLLLQHWGNKRIWEFFKANADFDSTDIIIRIRADLFIHGFQRPLVNNEWEAFCPWWGKFGGVNDRLAVMGVKAAEAYFTVYDKILGLLKQGCPFHPETLVKESLITAGAEIHNTLMTEFSTVRENGDQRWPEIRPSDHAELIHELCSRHSQ